ncbi:MAG TPA: hypothetical protein VHJ40_06440 [Actinomycetota bacterium]|nr:hypothetical protein [Actinomycetota bacterium]
MTGFTLGMVAGALWLLFFVALGLTAHNSPGHPFRSIRKFRSTRRSLVEVSSTGEAIMDTQHSRGPRAPGSDVDSFLKRYRSIAASQEPRKTTSSLPRAGAGSASPISEKTRTKGSLASRLLPWRKTPPIPEPIKTTTSTVRPIKRTKPQAAPAGRFIPPYNYLRPSGYTIPTPRETETLVPTVSWTPPSVEPASAAPAPPPSSRDDWEYKMTNLETESVKLLDPKKWPLTEDETEDVGEADEQEVPEIGNEYEPPYLSEGEELPDRFVGSESARDLRGLIEDHADPTEELDEPGRPSSHGSDHFKAAMDLLARVAKEVEDLESITEGPADRALGLGNEPMVDEDEYVSSEIAAELMAEFEQASTSHRDSGTHGSAEPERNGGSGEPESAPFETSSFESPLATGRPAENGGSALIAGADVSDDDLDDAAEFDAQRSVWTYEGISYFLVDDKGRPVLG